MLFLSLELFFYFYLSIPRISNVIFVNAYCIFVYYIQYICLYEIKEAKVHDIHIKGQIDGATEGLEGEVHATTIVNIPLSLVYL